MPARGGCGRGSISTNTSSEPIRIGSGSTMLAAPTSQQPWMMVISDRLVGPRMATWSPGTMPRACSAAPTARASSCNCAHETACVAVRGDDGRTDEMDTGRPISGCLQAAP